MRIWIRLNGEPFAQALLCLVPLCLSASDVWPEAKYAIFVVFPLGVLVGLGLVEHCPSHEIPYWCLAGVLASAHMFLISWLVYRRAVWKFERMCSEGTVDTGSPVVR